MFVPLRFTLGVPPSAAASDERTGDNRGRYQSGPYIHSPLHTTETFHSMPYITP